MAQSHATAQSSRAANEPEHDGKEPNTKLYEELGELARFIDTTMRTLSEFSAPVNSSTEQLPQAVSHLTNLKTLTEQGTHEVMRQVEAIQDNHARIGTRLKELTHALQQGQASPAQLRLVQNVEQSLGEDDKRLLDIMWKIDGETVETVADFSFGGSKITADGSCSHEIKRRLPLGREIMTNLDSILKTRDVSHVW